MLLWRPSALTLGSKACLKATYRYYSLRTTRRPSRPASGPDPLLRRPQGRRHDRPAGHRIPRVLFLGRRGSASRANGGRIVTDVEPGRKIRVRASGRAAVGRGPWLLQTGSTRCAFWRSSGVASSPAARGDDPARLPRVRRRRWWRHISRPQRDRAGHSGDHGFVPADLTVTSSGGCSPPAQAPLTASWPPWSTLSCAVGDPDRQRGRAGGVLLSGRRFSRHF